MTDDRLFKPEASGPKNKSDLNTYRSSRLPNGLDLQAVNSSCFFQVLMEVIWHPKWKVLAIFEVFGLPPKFA